MYAGYPEQYLGRCKLPKSYIHALLKQNATLPNSAPSAAASQMYIALYFTPEVLQSDSGLMKAVVSQSFRQGWVVAWAPGHLADVSLQWQRYRAARNALGNVLTSTQAKGLTVAYRSKMLECQKVASKLIQEQVDKVSAA